jgi:hypothetical protein
VVRREPFERPSDRQRGTFGPPAVLEIVPRVAPREGGRAAVARSAGRRRPHHPDPAVEGGDESVESRLGVRAADCEDLHTWALRPLGLVGVAALDNP